MPLPAWHARLRSDRVVLRVTQDRSCDWLRLLCIDHLWRVHLDLPSQPRFRGHGCIHSAVAHRIRGSIDPFDRCTASRKLIGYRIYLIRTYDDCITREIFDLGGIATVVAVNLLKCTGSRLDWGLRNLAFGTPGNIIRYAIEFLFGRGGFRVLFFERWTRSFLWGWCIDVANTG